MNNTAISPQLGPLTNPEPNSPGPSALEMTVGILTIVLALAAVAVALVQVHHARAAKARQTDPESLDTIELSRLPITQQLSPQVSTDPPAATVPRRYFTQHTSG